MIDFESSKKESPILEENPELIQVREENLKLQEKNKALKQQLLEIQFFQDYHDYFVKAEDLLDIQRNLDSVREWKEIDEKAMLTHWEVKEEPTLAKLGQAKEDSAYIGGYSPNSYLIVKGLSMVLLHEGKIIFAKNLRNQAFVRMETPVYIPPRQRAPGAVGRYFFYGVFDNSQGAIFEKKIDGKPPVMWLDDITSRASKPLKYCMRGRGLMVNTRDTLKVVRIKDRQIFELINMIDDFEEYNRAPIPFHIQDVAVMGRRQCTFIVVTYSGLLFIQNIEYNTGEQELICYERMQLNVKKTEYPTTVAVCNNSMYICVATKSHQGNLARMLMYRTKNYRVEYLTQLEYSDDQFLGSLENLIFYRNCYNFVVFLGVTYDQNLSTLMAYDFDIENKKLFEMDCVKNKFQFRNSVDLISFGETVYGCDEDGKILGFRFGFRL